MYRLDGGSAPCGSSGILAKAMAVAGDTEGGALTPCTGEMSAAALEVPVASLAGELVRTLGLYRCPPRVRTIVGGLGEADRREAELWRCGRGVRQGRDRRAGLKEIMGGGGGGVSFLWCL